MSTQTETRPTLTTSPAPTHYQLCIDCQRPMRPYRSHLADHPGTISRAGENCSSCANARAKELTRKLNSGEYDTCEGCQRPMRPYGALAVDNPGTVSRCKVDECASCHRARRDGSGPVTRPKLLAGTPCTGCNKPLRPKGTKASTHPGTVPHQAGGKCRPCHYEDPAVVNEALANRNRTAALVEAPEGLTGRDAQNRRDLENYMAARRARNVPVFGWSVEDWAARTAVAA